MTTTGNISS